MAMTYPPRRSWNGSGTSLSPPVRSCSRHSANCQRYSGFAEAVRGARKQRARTDSSTVRRSFMTVTSWPAARARLAPREKNVQGADLAGLFVTTWSASRLDPLPGATGCYRPALLLAARASHLVDAGPWSSPGAQRSNPTHLG